MNKNVLIVLAGGFVIAILVAVLVQASLGSKPAPDNAPRLQVLVAAKELPIGTELGEGDLKWQTWPGSEAFSGAIVREGEGTAEEALKGRLIQRVAPGQPVLGSYVFKEGKGNVVAAMLTKGMRAVAIPVNADTTAGGFVSPGDYVDVILTYELENVSSDDAAVGSLVSKSASETILQNVKVLATDQDAERKDDEVKVARTVTLEVDTQSSEKLSLAASMGDISLALRGIGDTAIVSKTSTTDVQLGRVMQDVARLKGSDENGGTVRIYNGPVMQTVRARNMMPVESSANNNAGQNTGEAGAR